MFHQTNDCISDITTFSGIFLGVKRGENAEKSRVKRGEGAEISRRKRGAKKGCHLVDGRASKIQ